MRLKYFSFILVVLLISSCKENQVTVAFQISNRTESRIDSLRIYPSGYECNCYISIPAGKQEPYTVDMTHIAKSDGDYQLDFKFDTSEFITKRFGYYSNGHPLESLIRISIELDSILVK